MKQIHINRRAGAFPPLGGSTALAEASPEELRVLLCLIEAEQNGTAPDTGALAKRAGCSAARVGSALRYWLEVGVLTEAEPGQDDAPAVPAETANTAQKTAPKPLSREPAAMAAGEIAEVVDREQMAAFIDSCQQVAGRVFNTRELETVVSLMDELPFSQEYMLTLASFCKKKSGRARFSVRYLAQVAYTMLERECLTVEQLNAYIAAAERFSAEEWKLRRLLGIGERRLSAKEQEYFIGWTGELAYGEEIIGIAYDITVDRTGKISLAYMDKLLRGFHAAGCVSEADVQAHLAREREEHAAKRLAGVSPHTGAPKGKKEPAYATGKSEKDPTATRGSSFLGGDYMSAALRRSYGDEGKDE